MGEYEKEMRYLQGLWADVENEESVDINGSDENTDSDHVSVNSDHSDIEQIPDDDNAVEENANLQADDLDSASTSNDNENNNYFFGKDGTKWRKFCYNRNVRTRAENIIIHLPGVKQRGKNAKSPFECFSLFIDHQMIDDIVRWTNQRIIEKTEQWQDSPYYQETTDVEIRAFLGLLYLAGVFRNGHRLIKDLWKTDGTGVEMFRLTMAQRRFEFLLTCIRFDNKENRTERRQIDKLAAIRAIVEQFTENCKSAYTPSEYLTIDEKLESFRGRCSFRQYMPNKPAKYGLKVQALVDARTHYLLNMEVYVGKQPPGPFEVSNSPADIVERLILPVSKTNRNITFDNWYTSYDLLMKLRQDHRLTAVGTIRKNKREIPPSFLMVRGREAKSTLYGFQENCTAISYVPKKGKIVLLMSTLHHDDSVNDTEKKLPEIISFYNLTKGGVDTVDELSATYSVSRNCCRWPLVLFFSIMNTAGINSQIIFRENTGTVIKRKDFLTQLGFELISDYQKTRMYNLRIPRDIRIAIHRIRGEPEEPAEKKARTSQQGRCQDCSRARDRKTKYFCRVCDKFICLEHANMTCNSCVSLNE